MPDYNDGAVPYGFATFADLYTAPNSGVQIGTYVVESLTFDEAGFQVDRRNGSNVMSGRVAGDDTPVADAPSPKTGTVRLQRATSSTVSPQIGNAFIYEGGDLAISNLYYVITGCTQNLAQAEAHTFECRFAATALDV